MKCLKYVEDSNKFDNAVTIECIKLLKKDGF